MGAAIGYVLHMAEPTIISKPKKVDISAKHPFPIKCDIFYDSFAVYLLKLLVLVVDVVTLPFYALYQQPWKNRAANVRKRAQLENPNNPYSAYVRIADGTWNDYAGHYVFKPETLPEFQQHVLLSNSRSQPSLGYRKILGVCQEESKSGKMLTKLNLDSEYTWISNAEVDRTIGKLARAFLHRGIAFQERVVIFAETRYEWFLCAQALFRIGSIVATLYATLGIEGIIYGITQTEVEHVITTEDLLPNLLKAIDRLPKVRHITVIELHQKGLLKLGKTTQADFDQATSGSDRKVQLTTYEEMLQIGTNTSDDQFVITRPGPNDVAVLLYTSGSTGNPKGVIQTHRNFVAQLRTLYKLFGGRLLENSNAHCFFGCLPLAHTFEMICELYFFGAGARIGYGTAYTMTDNGSAVMQGQHGDLKVLKPTHMAAVPLILDRIRKSLTAKVEAKGIFWQQLFKYACAYKNYWIDHGYDTPLVNWFICKKVQEQLGGRVQFMLVGGAPLSPDTQRVMRAFLNIKLLNAYGTTETCSAMISCGMEDISIGRIGAPLSGIKVRLIDWPEGGYSVNDQPRPRGELVIGSECITKGYFKLPDKTAEAYEEVDGVRWFKTGDIAQVFPNGTMKIIDRKKDLVKLQFGEYISLGKVEAELKNFKYTENVCVYCDSKQMYTIAFISPTIGALRKLATELNKPETLTLEQLCADSDIVAQATKELLDFGLEAGLNKMEIPHRIKLCPEEWSVKTGFLTASLKINRQAVRKFYQADIDRMYSTSSNA